MCGIVGYIGSRQASPIIVDALRKLEYRGYDSSGIATLDQGAIHRKRTTGTISPGDPSFLSLPGTMGIGHVRWATHGGVTTDNAHPHIDCPGKIAVVHNGTIENFATIRDELRAGKHHFTSETDTEVVAHILEEIDIRGALTWLEGTYALLVLDAAKQRMIAACYRSPLVITVIDDGEGILVSSSPLVSGRQYVLQDGDIFTMERSTDNRQVVIKPELPAKPFVMPTSADDTGEHRMLNEIREQPDVLRRMADTDERLLYEMAVDMLRAERVIFTASGTSRFGALIGRYLMAQGTHRLGEVIASSEFGYFRESVHRGTAVIAVSQSGETADILDGLRAARDHGAVTLGVTNNELSQMVRLCDRVLLTSCGPEYGVAATKTFIGQLAAFYLLRGAIVGDLSAVKQDMLALADTVEVMIRDSWQIVLEIAKLTETRQDFYYLGRGINFAVAGEAALKLKEVSYIHAEGMAAGELKHGPLALVSDGTLVCGICPNDFTYRDMITNLHEVKARRGTVIGVAEKRDAVFDYWIPVPSVAEIYHPVVCSVIGQMLAYQAAVERGLNPDRPRNLAKSVTVS